jgi:hypothetical protein
MAQARVAWLVIRGAQSGAICACVQRPGRQAVPMFGRSSRLERARVMYGPPWSAPGAAAAGAAPPGAPARRQAGLAGPARAATPASSWTRRNSSVAALGSGATLPGGAVRGAAESNTVRGNVRVKTELSRFAERNLAFKFDHGICIAVYRRRHFLTCPACHVGTPHQHWHHPLRDGPRATRQRACLMRTSG